MRQDNVVKGVRSLRSLVPHLRHRLIDTPRRAAAFGITAAVASGALMMAATHDTAVKDEMAKAAVVTTAVTDRSAALASGKELATRSLDRAAAAKAKAAAARLHAAKAKAKRKAAAIAARKKALAVKPVAGLDARQMRNAAIIVRAGQELGVSKRGQIVAVATAMQESNLYNLASYVVPESLKYSHEGLGADYDSVGLFQQRYTTGWGTVKSIMNPAESAKKFYRALMQVGGWQNLPVTVAAQIVQGSAFPDAYAQHTARAALVVNAVNAHR
jgi:hypothetical protein